MVLDDRHLHIHAVERVPTGWKTVHLQDVTDSNRPITYGVVVPGEFYENGTLLIRAKDYSNGWAEQTDMYRVGPDIDKAYKRSVLKADDILLTIVGSVGNVARVPSRLNGANITQQTARIAPDVTVSDGEFLFNYLRSNLAQREVYHFLKVGAQPALNLADVAKFRLLYPPLPEQQKIAAILSVWDRAIELTEKLFVAKQKRKQALMQQLLTGKVRLPGFTEQWKTVKAGDIFKTVSVKNHPDERVLSVTQDMGVVYRDEMERKIGMNMDTTGSYKLVEPGDFVISLRSFQGGLEMSRIRGITSPAYHVIRPFIDIDREFYRHFFKSYEFIGRLAVAVIGIRDGKQINFADFAFLKFGVPPIEEQKAISAVLTTSEQELTTLNRKVTLLKDQKKGLMQQLLTGKVRVNVDVEMVKG